MDVEVRTISGRSLQLVESISISRSIENLVSTCDLQLALPSVSQVDLSGLLEVFYDNRKVFTGYIFDQVSANGDGTIINFMLLSKTANVARCMHTGPKTFTNASLRNILESILNPFNVQISSLAKNPTVASFAINNTETAFSAIDRLLKENGLLITDNVDGNVDIIERNITTSTVSFIVGRNVKVVNSKFSMHKVHSEITVISENKDQGTISATARDLNAVGYSPLIIKAESKSSKAILQQRANYEVAVRAARKRSITLELPNVNWYVSGRILTVNEVVNLTNPIEPSSNGLYMIKSLDLSFNKNGGHGVKLVLSNPDEFLPRPEVPKETKTTAGVIEVNIDA